MSFRVERNVMVPMRDGVTLATDLWIPDAGPSPVLLVRTPYDKNRPMNLVPAWMPNGLGLLDAGYAIVWQDCRGTSSSAGDFDPMANEAADGADTVAWLRQQPWCDGHVGSFGPSYLGLTQWATASQFPAGLESIASVVSATDWYSSLWYSVGGAMSWHAVWFWSTFMTLAGQQRSLQGGGGDPQALMDLAATLDDPRSLRRVAADQEQLADLCSWWSDWMDHPDRDEFWQQLCLFDRFDALTTPALHVGGWFDIFADATARAFTKIRTEAGAATVREGQRLIIGPWDHLNASGVYHDRQFGLAADASASDLIAATHVAFYDRWLRGRVDALDGAAPVRIFVMGIDQWRDEQDWPLPDTTYVDYFLDSDGDANTAAGGGVLSVDPPAAAARDSFDYDPRQPVPSCGGRIMLPAALNSVGPTDQSAVESRDDVLCFTTAVLEQAVEVTGHISLILHVASSARDTDFTGKLVDVFPDGRAIYLTDGILRCRYRESLSAPRLLEPEQVYEIAIDMSVTSNVFLAGHRIRLEISSSNFPRYDRNTNTGGTIAAESLDEAVVATNQVLHGPAHPSRLVLPVIRR